MRNKSFGTRIHILRKQANLTQKELANMLGVSEPAVCKWETDSSMPDIMLLTPLARALHTDVNTLFAYEEIMSADKVKELSAAAENMGLTDGAEKELSYWKQILQEYPNSELLKLEYVKEVTKLQQQGLLTEEQYIVLETMLLKLEKSEDIEVRETALLYLISYYIRLKKYDEAEKYINEIPAFDFNSQHMKALLYFEKKDYAAGLKQSEQFLLECAQNMLICLSHMSESAHVLGDKQREAHYIEMMCQLEEMLQIPFYRGAAQRMMYHIRLEDYDKALDCFEEYADKMIHAHDILKESEFFAEVYPDAAFISNGSFISLEDFMQEQWKVMKKPVYMSRIREEERFALAMKKLEDYFTSCSGDK